MYSLKMYKIIRPLSDLPFISRNAEIVKYVCSNYATGHIAYHIMQASRIHVL